MDYQKISKMGLFSGMSPEETGKILQCLNAKEKTYRKGDCLCSAGDLVEHAGLLLTGALEIRQNDLWGNQNILSRVEVGELFLEAYACIPKTPSMVDVWALSDCAVLYLDTGHMIQNCPTACSFHTKLIQNLLSALAEKNLQLTKKIVHTSFKTIRERVLSYLSFEAVQQKKRKFLIPFSRQQMADYLSVERSALSKELGKMQREGLIRYRKNEFEIL